MEHIIDLLKRHRITDVVATVQFLSSVIRNYFRDGSDLGVSLAYATEEVPLGTAGSVFGAHDLLSGTFLVISGDALTDIDLNEAVEFHHKSGAMATIVLKRMHDPLEFGIVMTDDDGRIQRFLEKPSWGQVFSDTINTGIYVLEPEIFDLIPPDQPFDFSSELFPMMLDKGLPIFGYVTDAYWTDVGTTEAYLQAQQDALAGKVQVDLAGFELRPSVWVGEDVDVHSSAQLEGPVLIGDNSVIGAGARVGPFSVVGANALVGDDATVIGGLVMDRAHIGPFARVTGAALARGASLGRGATLEDGAVLGDEVRVGAGAIVKSQVKVYPGKTVEAGAIVTQNVVRERRASRSLFGARGVSGLVNVGITPIHAVRLGMAYGTTLKRGSVVVTGRDGSRAARIMKRAIVAGLNATGVTCHDLELAPMPLTRFTVRSEQASGGIVVRTPPGDPESVEIRLFDGDGADLPESTQRAIERIFFREDYRRAGPLKLGELEFPPHALEQYSSGLLRVLDTSRIRERAPKVVVDFAYGAVSLVGPALFGRLGCDLLAVNGFIDEHRPSLSSEDLIRLREGVVDHVRNSGSDLGALMEPGGEVAHLVDDLGRVVDPERLLLAFLRHESTRGVGTMAVPVSSSWACEEIAADAGATLQRTATGLPALMARAQRADVGFAGNGEGALIFPALLPAPDAVMTFCKALEMVATAGRPLSEIIDDLPEVHLVRRDVATPWDRKGAVMRQVASVAAPGKLVLLDGVKVVENDRWALVIPLPDEPSCRVWAEAPTIADAEALAERWADVVADVAAAAD
jgi:mannose-1-phosphate guanylyltransferase/phosphomannomutase